VKNNRGGQIIKIALKLFQEKDGLRRFFCDIKKPNPPARSKAEGESGSGTG